MGKTDNSVSSSGCLKEYVPSKDPRNVPTSSPVTLNELNTAGATLKWFSVLPLGFCYKPYLVYLINLSPGLSVKFQFIDCNSRQPVGAEFTINLQDWGLVHPELPSTLPEVSNFGDYRISILMINRERMSVLMREQADLVAPDEGKWPRSAGTSMNDALELVRKKKTEHKGFSFQRDKKKELEHLLVIGRRLSPRDLEMDEAHAKVRNATVVRADNPGELVGVVEDYYHKQGCVDILDIYDHGNEGVQTLGDGALFRIDPKTGGFDREGFDIASAIAPFLSETAQVRLLGCRISKGMKGKTLLSGVADALAGRRIVMGSLLGVDSRIFSSEGFYPSLERCLLVSSSETSICRRELLTPLFQYDKEFARFIESKFSAQDSSVQGDATGTDGEVDG